MRPTAKLLRRSKYHYEPEGESSKLRQVLDYCNDIRHKLVMGPRKTLCKGTTGRSRSCVITNTVGASNFRTRTQDYHYRTRRGNLKITEHPFWVNEFIRDFDSHQYPELEIDLGEWDSELREIINKKEALENG